MNSQLAARDIQWCGGKRELFLKKRISKLNRTIFDVKFTLEKHLHPHLPRDRGYLFHLMQSIRTAAESNLPKCCSSHLFIDFLGKHLERPFTYLGNSNISCSRLSRPHCVRPCVNWRGGLVSSAFWCAMRL